MTEDEKRYWTLVCGLNSGLNSNSITQEEANDARDYLDIIVYKAERYDMQMTFP